jgi:hypothetical protein
MARSLRRSGAPNCVAISCGSSITESVVPARTLTKSTKQSQLISCIVTGLRCGDRERALAKEGARIIVNGRTPERVKEAMEQIKSQDGKAMLGFVIDSLD